MFKNKFFVFVIVFGLFMGGAFASAALLISSKLIENKQLQQKALIEQLLHSNLTEDAKVLSKQLRASVDFEYLTITDVDNNVLYRFIKDTKKAPALSFVLKHFDLYTPIQRVKTNQGKLVIEFQSSFSQLFNPLTLIIVVALFSPLAMTLLIYLISEFVQDKRLEKIVAVLEQRLLLDEPDASHIKKANKLPLFLPLIAKLEQRYKQKAPQTVEPSHKVDSQTGLANQAEFNHFYLNKVKVSGQFTLIRASDFSSISINRGEELADKYIQLIAKAIWQTFSFSDDCHIYRLNQTDFAVLLFDLELDSTRLINQLKSLIKELGEQQQLIATVNSATANFEPSLPLQQLLADIEQKLSNNSN